MAGAADGGDVVFQLLDASVDFTLERNNVLGEHSGKRATVVTVKIDQALRRGKD